MVSKFKSLSVLEEILVQGQFWETIITLEAISALEVVRSGELPVYQVFFFLDFLLFFFYIVFFYCLVYIFFISHLIYSLIILFSL